MKGGGSKKGTQSNELLMIDDKNTKNSRVDLYALHMHEHKISCIICMY